MNGSRRLRIARTWDGRPLGADEAATVIAGADDAGLELIVDAPFHGDPPPPLAPSSTEGLWEHEVVEVFVAGRSGLREPVYTEIELSPHGHHLVLTFEGIRERAGPPRPVVFEARIAGSRWEGRARIPRDLLPPPPWCLGAFSIHGEGPLRRHLAMVAHPGPRPDFHRPERFVPWDDLPPAPDGP